MSTQINENERSIYICALRNDDYGIHDSNYDLIEHVYSGSDLSGSQRPN